jgi:hypothetical protein
MFRSDDGEVPPIQRGDDNDTEALSHCDDGRINGAERKIMISGHQLSNSEPIARMNGFRQEVSVCEISEESSFRSPSQARLQKIDNFRDDELRNDERAFV